MPTNVCSLRFQIPDDIGPPVLLYYRLSNFFQNHRRYVKSLDSTQLKGSAETSTSACNPLSTNGTGLPYYPCGLIANSLFNDSYGNPILLDPPHSSADNETYPMSNQGIAWASDKDLYGVTQYKWNQVAPPPNWMVRYPNGYTPDQPPPNLHTDEAFQVWMRTAGLPTFSKLALRNDTGVMQSGMYQVDIHDSTSFMFCLGICTCC